MQRYYYNQLGKEEKKKILEKYKKDYADSEFQKRLVRLVIYSIIGFLFSIFLIGRYYAKLKILNKIALKIHS